MAHQVKLKHAKSSQNTPGQVKTRQVKSIHVKTRHVTSSQNYNQFAINAKIGATQTFYHSFTFLYALFIRVSIFENNMLHTFYNSRIVYGLI